MDIQSNRFVLPRFITLLICFTVSHYAYSSLQSDYASLVSERKALAAEDNTLIAQRKELDKSGRKLQVEWGSCAGGVWHIVWTPFETKLTNTLQFLGRDRKKLADMQRDLLAKERRLDIERAAIEEKYRENRGTQYEAEMRAHMSKLELNFLHPYKEEYLLALNEYLTAYEIWQLSVQDAVDACERGDIRAVLVTAAIQNLDRVLQTLDSIKTLLSKQS